MYRISELFYFEEKMKFLIFYVVNIFIVFNSFAHDLEKDRIKEIFPNQYSFESHSHFISHKKCEYYLTSLAQLKLIKRFQFQVKTVNEKTWELKNLNFYGKVRTFEIEHEKINNQLKFKVTKGPFKNLTLTIDTIQSQKNCHANLFLNWIGKEEKYNKIILLMTLDQIQNRLLESLSFI